MEEDRTPLEGDAARDLLNYDPFKDEDIGQEVEELKEEKETSPPVPPEGEAEGSVELEVEGEGGEAPVPAEDKTPAEPVPEPVTEIGSEGAKPQADPKVALMEQSLSDLREQNRQLMEMAQKAQAPAQQAQAPASDPLRFVPDDHFMGMMESEDANVRKQAIGGLVTGIAQAVRAQVLQEVSGVVQQNASELVRGEVSRADQSKAQQASIANDYYKNFPAHGKTPEMKQFVLTTAQRVFQETGASSWTPEIRNAVGARVNQALGLSLSPNAAKPKKPATQIKSNTTPKSKANSSESVHDQVSEMLFG